MPTQIKSPNHPFKLLILRFWAHCREKNTHLYCRSVPLLGPQRCLDILFYFISSYFKHSPHSSSPWWNTTHPSWWKGPCHDFTKKTETWSHYTRAPTFLPQTSTYICIDCIYSFLHFEKARPLSYSCSSPFLTPLGLFYHLSGVPLHILPLCRLFLQGYVQAHKALSHLKNKTFHWLHSSSYLSLFSSLLRQTS